VVSRRLGPIAGMALFIARHIIAMVISQAPVLHASSRQRAVVAAIERARNTMRQLLRFLRSEDGPTTVEYAVMLALIVVVCLAGVQALTQETAASYNRSASAIIDAIN